MKIYNSLTNKIEIIDKKETYNFYVCGPTVYDFLHIGNMRPFITADVLIKYLKFKNKNIKYIINITDIDDKIIDKAISEKNTEKKISEKYTINFLEDFKSLNLSEPNSFLKISDFIDEQIKFISKILENDKGYVKNGDVFFDIYKSKKQYGILANKKIEDLIPNKRLSENDNKNNPLDFALWKKTDKGINFKAPWSEGRPGWHTECATLNYLFFQKEKVDFHFGGIDLKFPHHENERIQYLAVENCELSKFWIHNGHLNFGEHKMSKSLNNTILIRDFIEKYDSNTLKIIFYKMNHTSPIDLTTLLIEQSAAEVQKIQNIYNKISYYKITNKITNSKKKYSYLNDVLKNLENNLNLPNCLTVLQEIIKEINKSLSDSSLSYELLEQFQIINQKLLGFNFKYTVYSLADEELILEYEKCKKNKNYQQSDLLREQLKLKNII
ncbi:cysteine--tRNA ligase [Spiroplasma endosymbiont of Amphibalanus improvisus]|uniref:cysteine--tRNA ligase n=1 Tax=Spiroplasma endosymbiont of Amphibalanus improvisus TaxID=3066327 RepID=UPI00313E0C98